ncbi:MAG TPA: AraC family transcriptional regulator [Pyrinomonadaceae bacterium]
MVNLAQQAAYHYGEQKKLQIPGVTLTFVHAENSRDQVGWHWHENPHVTFILQGDVIEGTKREVHNCSAGSVLFHSSFEPHYNLKLEGNTRCFHLDFVPEYLNDVTSNSRRLQGIFAVADPHVKLLCYKIFTEAVVSDDVSAASIHGLALEILGRLTFTEAATSSSRPSWVARLEEILRSELPDQLSLAELSRELSIHPVHLSRSFSQYFRCTFGEYVRRVRVQQSLAIMPHKNLSLTEIAFKCGFADQSHFSRSFRQIIGVSPSTYRKLLSN